MQQVEDPTGLPLGPSVLDRLLGAGILVLSLAVCIPALGLLRVLWTNSEFYGHAYAIPGVAAYLVWSARDRIREALLAPEPALLGPPILFAVASAEAIMILGDIGFGASVGVPFVIGAALYAFGGYRVLSPFILPLVFLVFMVPPPAFFQDQLLVQLKFLVTEIAVRVLQDMGQTITAEGNQVLIPGHTLFVADACSGLISIVTLMPLSAIVAYFLSHGIWRRAVVVASVIPLAVIANIFRVVVTVLMVSSWGIEYAEGVLHESFGLATYVVGTLALIGVAKALR